MSDVTVRPATRDDVSTIQTIGERGWRATYGDFLASETIDAAMDKWYTSETTREFVDQEDVGYFVAERDGGVVGYVSGGPEEGDVGDNGPDEATTARLGAIYVDPDCWGEGAGTELLAAFEHWCRDQGYDAVVLDVLADNEIGISFYRTHGFERVEKRETELFGESVQEFEFRREIEA
jgi:ribosomal protein S18 acetylase RimI-like enzyme